MYVIHGYLDRAPKDATVVDQVEIYAHGEETRTLLVTSYRSPGPVMLGEYLSWPFQRPYAVSGARDEVHRLLTAPPGAEVQGKFVVYAPAYPLLVIANLEQPAAPSAD